MLEAAEQAGFEVMITTDQGIPLQQNLTTRRIDIVILHAPTNRLSDLQHVMPGVIASLETISPGAVIRVG